MIKAIKIDVVNKTVYQIKIKNTLQGLYDGTGADLVEIVRLLKNGDDIYIDEEGRLKEKQLGAFIFDAGTTEETFPLVGHGLIVGHDEEGDCINAKSTVEEIKKRVSFTSEHQPYIPPVIITGSEAEDYFRDRK